MEAERPGGGGAGGAARRGQAIRDLRCPATRAGMVPETLQRDPREPDDDVPDVSSGLRTRGGDFEIPRSEKNSSMQLKMRTVWENRGFNIKYAKCL